MNSDAPSPTDSTKRNLHPDMTRRDLIAFAAFAAATSSYTLTPTTAHGRKRTAKQRSVPTDPTDASATVQAYLIRNGQITPLELAQLVVAKIKRVDAKIGAVEHLAEQQALEQAQAATNAIRNGRVNFDKQRLFGVLMGVKDAFEVDGMPTTSGAPTLRKHISHCDATVVRKLKEQGAIPVVKTRLPLLGFAHESINLFGTARNPYDVTRTAGGSSGGAAALSAAGGTPFDIGSDGGASIRNPAHCCGVAGLVPAYGRVSVKGKYPPLENSGDLHYLSIGPIARRVEDLALVYDIIAGVDPHDPFTWPMLKGDYRQIRMRDLRIGYWSEARHTNPTHETIEMVEESAKALRARGAKVIKIPAPVDMKKCGEVWFSHGAYWLSDFFEKTVPKYGAQGDPLVQHCRKIPEVFFAKYSAVEIARLQDQMPALRERISASMNGFDAVLTPVKASPALPHFTIADVVRKNLECHPYTHSYGLVFSLPSGTVRCGTSPEGLPLGIHVVGSPAREDKVLAVLDSLEQEFGGWTPSPLFA